MNGKPKMLVLRGIPASGKSTFAKKLIQDQPHWYRLNDDLLREMLHGDLPFSGKREKFVRAANKATVRALLENQRNVVIDNTNLTDGHYERWKNVADEFGAECALHVMGTPLVECVQRNVDRGLTVPTSVIVNMARQIRMPDAFGAREIICDIDGTVAEISHRLKFMRGEEKDWDKAFSLIHKDGVRWEVVAQVKEASKELDASVVFVSARQERERAVTESWLAQLGLNWFTLVMRPTGDFRDDVAVKRGILNKYFEKDRIVKVFDDRLRVLSMWEEEFGEDVVVSVNVGNKEY